MTSPVLEPRPRRGWMRGLLAAGIALAAALLFRGFERHPGESRPEAPPVPAARPMPADASLGAPSQSVPRLLVLLPATPAADQASLPAALRRASAGHLAVTEGDANVAKAMGLTTLPAFVLYDRDGRERRRFGGPGARADLLAELRALAIPVDGLEPRAPP